jgi:glucose/arabinose dehydrogenase
MRYLILIPAIAAAACDSSTEPPPGVQVEAVEIAAGLANPLHLTAPSGDDRLFIVEQEGRIRIMEDGVLLDEPFLDLRPVCRRSLNGPAPY